ERGVLRGAALRAFGRSATSAATATTASAPATSGARRRIVPQIPDDSVDPSVVGDPPHASNDAVVLVGDREVYFARRLALEVVGDQRALWRVLAGPFLLSEIAVAI